MLANTFSVPFIFWLALYRLSLWYLLIYFRAGVKAALLLLPLLGLTWAFGLMVVHKHLLVFEYLFALFNSLQGFFIFLFHCLCNKEVSYSLFITPIPHPSNLNVIYIHTTPTHRLKDHLLII